MDTNEITASIAPLLQAALSGRPRNRAEWRAAWRKAGRRRHVTDRHRLGFQSWRSWMYGVPA